MDPQTDLPDLVEDLEVNIDELSTVLAPLLDAQLSTTASSLPLLDKAKLYVLAAYAIESLLYSTLQASGVDAKEHAIFKELARLKGYFGKIKSVEERTLTPAAPKSKLDVGAAARFIKHGLAGNDRYDLERAERMAKERARAQLKARQINKKFDDEGKAHPKESTPKKRDIEEVVAAEPAQSNDDSDAILQGLDDGLESPSASPPASEPPIKKPKIADLETMDVDSPAPSPSTTSNAQKPATRKSKRSTKKKSSATTSDAEIEPSQDASPETPPASTRPKRKQRGKKGASKSSADEADAAGAVVEEKPKRGRGRPRGSGKGK
jgi:exosome complex protein LRP1